MLRNIPNRVTQAQLKEIFDNTSLGDYDFMYLRIGMCLALVLTPFFHADLPLDFANNCKYVPILRAFPLPQLTLLVSVMPSSTS